MVYVMSDLHGEYEKYCQMLEKIKFTDDDILYVVGDVIDRGKEPLKILEDMSMRSNVYPIIGNHEVMAIEMLEDLLLEVTEENCQKYILSNTLTKLMEWQQNGGEVTLNQFKALPPEEREIMLDYLKEFTTLEVVEMGRKTFILVHSGFANFEPEKSLDEYTPYDVAFIRPEYDRPLFRDKTVYIVAGHTPTFYITGKNEIYQANNYICIDCGATFGGKLACLRLDDMAEFYV